MRKTLLIPCLLSALAAQGFAQTQMTSRQNIPSVVASARGTVVLLKTFDRQGHVLALGSGFRIVGGRYVTNAHVVEGASRVEIFDDTGALLGIARSADMLSTTVDLAILPSVGRRAPYLSLADVAPAVGEQVIVIGAPEGLTNTVSDGIVSALRRVETRQLLQISAPISPGSSGGPVLNTRGEVVGVSVSILREGQNLNFAVPVSDVIALVSSRPGQFEFPTSTEAVSQRAAKTDEPPRSSAAAGPVRLRVGSEVKGQLTADDRLPGGGYMDYYRFDGEQDGSVSIWVGSGDFDPWVGVFRSIGDSIVLVASNRGGSSTPALAVFAPVSGVTYFITVGVTDSSRSKMGGYTVRVASAPNQAEERWLEAATTDNATITFDRTRITNTGSGTYVVWWRSIFRTLRTSDSGKSYDGSMTQYEISCTEDRLRILSTAFYLKDAAVLQSDETTSWHAIIPETVAEAAGTASCGYIKAHGL